MKTWRLVADVCFFGAIIAVGIAASARKDWSMLTIVFLLVGERARTSRA